MASCIFCGLRGTSREHVWPQWVSAVLAERGSFRLEAEQLDVRRWTEHSQLISLVTKRVCARCNNGWMSQLETSVRPTLEPMLRGHTLRIVPAMQAVVTRWIVKTVMVLEHTGAAVSKKFFAADEHRAVRSGLQMPSRLHVWLAHVVDPAIAAWASGSNFAFYADDHPSAEPGAGYTATVSAGAVVFQLVCLRPHRLLEAAIEPEFTNEAGWGGYSQRLWPATSECPWPPTKTLDHELLRQYGARFGGRA